MANVRRALEITAALLRIKKVYIVAGFCVSKFCVGLMFVCCLHIKSFFLLNDIITPSVRADSSS